MVNKALLKRMAGEVSIGILAEMVADYAQGITEADEVDDGVLEVVSAIETLTAEIKSRSGNGGSSPKTERSRRSSKRETKPAEPTPEPAQPNVQPVTMRPIGNVGNGNHRE